MAESEIMEAKKQIAVLKEIVRVGTVSSVDVEQRTAKVIIYDKIKEFVSGPLKVLQNQPLITVEKWGDGTKWEYDAKYASVDRSLGLGESYTKAAPDVIKNETPGGEIKYAGEIREHKQTITVYPWLPYIGQLVICLYLPHGEGGGFVLGGL